MALRCSRAPNSVRTAGPAYPRRASRARRSCPTSPAAPMPPLTSPPPGSAFPPGYGPPGATSYASAPNVRIDPVVNAPLAPWWKRLLAVIIDWAILGAGYFVVLAIVGALVNSHRATTTTTTTTTNSGAVFVGLIVLFVLASIPNSLYFGLMNGSRRGQTVGKMALSISVRDAHQRPVHRILAGLGTHSLLRRSSRLSCTSRGYWTIWLRCGTRADKPGTTKWLTRSSSISSRE